MNDRKLDIHCGIEMPERLDATQPIRAFAHSSLGLTRDHGATHLDPQTQVYWDQAYFGLEGVQRFQSLPIPARIRVMQNCSRLLLDETFYIEKIGMAYAAKMALLARSTDERMYYCGMASEEARHFGIICQFLPTQTAMRPSPFVKLISDIVETEEADVLMFVVQVLLEGWGLSHYRDMAHHTNHPTLAKVLREFVRDEARHHGGGIVLFESVNLKRSLLDRIDELLETFLQMVRIGPVGVASCLEAELGPLSPAERAEIYRELKGEVSAQTKLGILKHLIVKDDRLTPLVKSLESRQIFTPNVEANL